MISKYDKFIFTKLPDTTLRNLAIDIRAQVNMGLMSDNEASEILNKITATILAREVGDGEEVQCS
jgi:hypothetical protein